MFLVKLNGKCWASKNNIKCERLEYAARYKSEQAARSSITKCRSKVPWIYNPYPKAKIIKESEINEEYT